MSDRTGARMAILLAAALAPVVSTCGSSAAGSCGKVAPCGGDIVGNWTISDGCVSNAAVMSQLAQAIPNCPTVMASAGSVHATGSASFNADMTYTLTETLSASGHATVPPTCLQTAGITLTCDQVDQLLQALIAANSIPVKSAHCAGSGSCECDVTLAPTTTNEMGTYATSGTTLTTTSSTSAVNSIGYCVQKNELHMPAIDVTMPTDAMGNPNISSDTVFRKN